MTQLMLGGVPIVLHAGAPDFSEEAIGGETVLRMSDGAAVKMRHWQKASGSISGTGWMPPGLDGLDYSGPLELRSTQVSSIVGTATSYTLTSTPRPDHAPWALALVGEQWVEASSIYSNGVLTVIPVAGATLYSACWFPVYSVFASKPPRGQGGGSHTWSISWEEV